MIPDILKDHFVLLADTPGGVQKLRELVLRIAMLGKIVPSQIGDEPARRGLQRTQMEKEQRIATKDFNVSPSDEEHYLKRESPLPSGWVECQVSDVCELKTGATPSRAVRAYFGGNIKWLVSGDIHQKEIYDCDGRITNEGIRNSNCRLLPVNSVLIALNGQGKTRATVAVLRTEAACNQSLVAMTPILPDVVLAEYLFWNLRSKYFAIRAITGQKQRRGLNMKLVGSLSLELPPLAEQKRIVAKVEELMVLCDELETRQEDTKKVQAHLNQFALARLTQSKSPAEFSNASKIVAQNFQCLEKTPENVSNLRKTILQFAAEGRLAGISSTTAWQTRPLEDIAVVAGGVTKGRKLGGRKTVTLPYLRVANVQRGSLNLSVIKEIAIPEEERERYRLKRDDLLTTEGGDWDKVGRTAIWHEEIPLCLHQNHVFRSRLNQEIACPEWIALVINSPVGREYFEAAAKQTTNLASINMTELRAFPIPLPPLAEQKRIVAKVGELMKLCDELEAQLERAEADGAAVRFHHRRADHGVSFKRFSRKIAP
jgi:type I restriction enzyme, S subunit